ncbi:hypothetical protein ACHAXR_004109 [Thalassiosira sp. AJA248-18]
MSFVWVVLYAFASHLPSAHAFAFSPATTRVGHNSRASLGVAASIARQSQFSTTKLYAEEDSNEVILSESESSILGIAGIVAANIMIYSESVLFRTGCGLPAGPAGLVGAAEGVSYLGVVGLVAFSLFTKIRTGKGLPSGPGGYLGAAEGLSYLAIIGGVIVLAAQVTNYGYIPNAVPMEGGMCQ